MTGWRRARSWGVRSALVLLLVAGACTTGDADDEASSSSDTVTAAHVQNTEAVTEQADPPAAGEGGDGEVGFEDIPDLVERVIGSVLAIQTPAGGEGSGVVFGDDGTAVTNAHVVGEFSQVRVVTAAGETLEAEVVGTDPLTDLAVLQLGSSDLPALEFADELPRVGSLAVAIGNPLGFENTVSAGVVSGLERSIPGGGPALVGLLQTDAAISPGNSGGALIGAEGTVIGINVAYIPPTTSGAVSIGFAIPSPVVIDVVEQLRNGRPVRHAFVGIQPRQVDPGVAAQLGLSEPRGVLVLSVVSGGPADRAGLQPGDVVLALDGDAFETVTDFLAALRNYQPGDTVEMTVFRDGQEQTVSLTLSQHPGASG